MRLYGSFAKVDAEQRIVAGYASTECIDRTGEIVLKSAIEDALADYLEYGNIRAMHQMVAVGKTVEAEVDSKGLYISAHIVDDDAWKKVIAGVYAGFSIGGKTLARDPKDRSVITKVRLDEISLVDRPANPEATIDIWKAAGFHGGDVLAKVLRERNDLAKELASRDHALAGLADRTELMVKSITKIVAENRTYQKQIGNMTKSLAAVQPRVVNSEALKKTLVDLETIILPKLEADTALLRARFDHLDRGRRLDA